MDADPQTQIDALNAIGRAVMITIVCLGAVILLLGASHRMQRPSGWWDAATLAIAFVAISSVCSLMFDPNIFYTVRELSGPVTFIITGLSLGATLFYLRAVRRDVYGVVEVAVAIATLHFVGSNHSPATRGADLIGYVGAVYVIVRGITNIAETFQQRRER